jgi:ABC-type antimicrobial peptide transport system permease subunit
MARVAGTRAWVLATTGGAMAVPLGVGTLRVVTAAMHSYSPFPWLAASMVAVGIPAITGAGAYLSSRLSQRLRPVVGSTMSVD